LGEYVRTKVVPECDAYVISKLAGLAASRANLVNGDIAAPFKALCELIQSVQDTVGYDEELVAFIDSGMYAKLQNSSEISKMLTVGDFKQGEIDLQVRYLNGVAVIPVVSSRMKTAYTFNNTAAGGFTPAQNARQVYMLVCPKRGAHLIKKTEQMRIFTPEQNLDADAYKFDYRIYYDVFVKKSGLDAVWAWVSPAVNITGQPEDVEANAGQITASITVTAETESGTLSYQWYKCEDESGNGAVKLAGENKKTYTLPKELEAGEYYYFAEVLVDGLASTRTTVAIVTIN